jgi:hypothetical protein
VELRADALAGDERVTLRDGVPCHGTWPFARWRPGEVVVETLALPPIARGHWAVRLVLRGGGPEASPGAVLLGEVEVTR